MFEKKHDYPFEVVKQSGGVLRVIYTDAHPSSATRQQSGEVAGPYVCSRCGQTSHTGVYRHLGEWKCPTCKEADTPKKAPRMKDQPMLLSGEVEA